MTTSEYQHLLEFLSERFTEIDQRFVALERRVEDGFREMANQFRDVFGHFAEVYRRLERLEQEHVMITEALRRIELTIAGERSHREVLEQNLAELRERVVLLHARIDELERRLRG